MIEKGSIVGGSGSSAGSFFSIFCPACVPVIGSFFTAIGLGALLDMKLLGFLTVLFLLIGIGGLFINYKTHKRRTFLFIGIIASVVLYLGRYYINFPSFLYVSGIVLLGNAVFDYREIRKIKKCNNEECKQNRAILNKRGKGHG